MKRIHLIISGDVQGVGYRTWVRGIAKKLRITGWVKNREDGAVEVVAEGLISDLETFVTSCRRGPEVAWVEHVDVTRQEATGEFPGFEVIY
jgi:acylphosphatase